MEPDVIFPPCVSASHALPPEEPQLSQLYCTGNGDLNPDIEAFWNCRCGNYQSWKCGLRSTSRGCTSWHTTRMLWAHSQWAVLGSNCQLKLCAQSRFNFQAFLFGFLPHFTVFFSLLIGPCFLFGFIFPPGKGDLAICFQKDKSFDK